MKRRQFIHGLGIGLGASTVPVGFGSATDTYSNKWTLSNFRNSDFQLSIRMFQKIAKSIADSDKDEEDIILGFSQMIAESDPLNTLAQYYKFETPQDFEGMLSSVYKFDSGHFGFIVSIVQDVEEYFDITLPIHHIKACNRLFLLKSMLVTLANLRRISIEIHNKGTVTEGLKEKFYMAFLLFILEIVLMKYSLDYRIAWVSTRKLHNRLLVRVRSLIGAKGVSIVMKMFHWLVVRVGFTEKATSFFSSTLELVKFVRAEGPEIIDKINNTFEDVDTNFTYTRLEDYGHTIETTPIESPAEVLIDTVEVINQYVPEANRDTLSEVLDLLELDDTSEIDNILKKYKTDSS